MVSRECPSIFPLETKARVWRGVCVCVCVTKMGAPRLGQQIGLDLKCGFIVYVEALCCMAAVSLLLLPLHFGSD